MIQEIKEIWGQIRQNRPASDAISARPLPVSGLDQNDVLLCITQDSNAGLLLRSQGGSSPMPKTGCGRLIVRREQLLREGSIPDDYIRIECLESDLETLAAGQPGCQSSCIRCDSHQGVHGSSSRIP